jgi:hypothetical protein
MQLALLVPQPAKRLELLQNALNVSRAGLDVFLFCES